ncbi:SRPBCC family protein [Nakamurella aerolata]|uniref:SRPBCC family protein n=1 Tax=Nakamurella aerolata TaxID=1656892 RepID=A0A849A9T7_9ACTN|nr:SRPBCC family protein [Nakamurella aerolata]NNG37299.1 SRPBCC family protein [Nakamurella aerolata]
MTPVVATIQVERPAAEVFAYATDPTRFAEWQKGVVDGHLDNPSSPEIGTKCVTTRRIGFADRPITSELVHIDPPRTWRIRGIDGPIRATVDVAVEPQDNARSILTISIDFEGHGIGKILVPLVVVPEARREMPGNLEELKRRVEISPTT